MRARLGCQLDDRAMMRVFGADHDAVGLRRQQRLVGIKQMCVVLLREVMTALKVVVGDPDQLDFRVARRLRI